MDSNFPSLCRLSGSVFVQTLLAQLSGPPFPTHSFPLELSGAIIELPGGHLSLWDPNSSLSDGQRLANRFPCMYSRFYSFRVEDKSGGKENSVEIQGQKIVLVSGFSVTPFQCQPRFPGLESKGFGADRTSKPQASCCSVSFCGCHTCDSHGSFYPHQVYCPH